MKNNYLLDSWALLALMNEEHPAAKRVQQLLTEAIHGRSRLHLSIINLGEIYYSFGRRWGKRAADMAIERIKRMPIQLLPVDENLVLAAARYKMNYRLSYADAFAMAAAVPRHLTIVTGDPELFALEPEISIERLRRD